MSQDAVTAAAVAPEPSPQEGAIVRQAGMGMGFSANAGVRLQNFSELLAFGRAMIDSGFAPKGFTKPAQVVWAVQRGAELGIGPTASLEAFYVSPAGAPELYAEAALGICVGSGLLLDNYEKWVDGEGDKITGHFRFWRRGWKEPKATSFSVTEAKRAGLIKDGGNWVKWPQRMVVARVVSFALHDYFPDVLLGCAIEGDVVEHTVDVQASPAAAAAPTLPPETPDPLLAQVTGTTTSGSTPATEAELVTCDPGPPFASNAEADAAIADEEDNNPRARKPTGRL